MFFEFPLIVYEGLKENTSKFIHVLNLLDSLRIENSITILIFLENVIKEQKENISFCNLPKGYWVITLVPTRRPKALSCHKRFLAICSLIF